MTLYYMEIMQIILVHAYFENKNGIANKVIDIDYISMIPLSGLPVPESLVFTSKSHQHP